MTKRSWARVALLALVLGLTACGSSASVVPSATPTGPQLVTFSFGGLNRSYYLVVPGHRTGRLPLVLALHGYTQSPQGLEIETNLDATAADAGFVVVYPEGMGRSWDAGTCCGQAQSGSLDDVGFIKQVIDRLAGSGKVDAKRVFATGISNGGMMAHRLACELSDRILAVVSVSGALEIEACKPVRPISIMEMHGTADDVVPIDGGRIPGVGIFPPAISTMKLWAGLDGCAADSTIDENAATRTTTWAGCRDGTAVVLVAVKDGSHTFWLNGGTGPLDVNGLIWNFFSHQPART